MAAAVSVFAAEPVVPPLTGRVVDEAGILPAERRRALESRLEAFEAEKGAQVVVLTVATTAPWAIEQYSIQVAEAWKIGRKGVDDGIILLVARDDRALRIEVGRGLEGALTDLVSKRIIEDIIVPHFRSGDMAKGVEAGVDALIKVVEGEPLPRPTGTTLAPDPDQEKRESQWMAWFSFGSIPLAYLLRIWLGRFQAAFLSALLAGMACWPLDLFIPKMMVVAIVSFILTMLAYLAMWLASLLPGGARGSRGGGSGGGFRGGGGGFGGGGASGRF